MKVLQLIQKPQLRGAEIFACQLSMELKKIACTVDVAYLFSHEPFSLDFDLNFIPLDGNPRRRLWDLKAYRKLNKIVTEGGYDIVQANAGDTLKYAALSKFLFRWKAKLVFRNANKMGDFIKSDAQRSFNRFMVGQADGVISVSEMCRQDIIKLFPRTRDKATMIPIGTYDFTEVVAAKLNAPSPVWINISSFVPEKNHSFIIDVFKRSVSQGNKGTLLLVGEGRLRKEMEEKVRQLSLEDRVVFTGARKDAVALLKNASLLLLPSMIEGLPGVILEAFSCGVPVVASDVGGIPEIVRTGETGMCISGFDVNEYLDAIGQLSNDEARRSSIIRKAREVVEERFMMTTIAQRFRECYVKLISA
jgi:L-malate glycosyltransferase